jgi:putative membrane protein
MYAGSFYTVGEIARWTWRESLVLLAIATVPTVLHEWAGLDDLSLPWLPIALIGTAVAFLVGFKNSSSYDRLWEARKIWGGIVNTSRAWSASTAVLIIAPSPGPLEAVAGEARARLVDLQLAWLTALRHQLRRPREWERGRSRQRIGYHLGVEAPEWSSQLKDELASYLGANEVDDVLAAPNPAADLLRRCADTLSRAHMSGVLTEYRQVELLRLLESLFTLQGRCERIKNFPYPRQFATLNLYFVWIFILLVPFGLLEEFESFGPHMVWLTIPFSVLVAWVFHTMEKIGSATENPFEGGTNDVPMTAISRAIEIEHRYARGERELPESVVPRHRVLF